ncbi:Uncharacterized protein dnm_041470 [Desulfonema magnum]|uniref:Uncharacterized protein n=1 Tax=Desulfonema magnum TaxID=45655 RepID=A0A975GNL6_9BACT|nr:Uncharacterized protein dnm_041470 [Desulfonema magnum]
MRVITLFLKLFLKLHQILTEKPAYERCHFIAKPHPEISSDADRKTGL